MREILQDLLRRCRLLLLSISVVAIIVAGCGASTPTGSGPVPLAPARVFADPATAKVLLIVLENHGTAEALQQMPFLASQGRRYAEATHSSAVGHPSLPNYLALTGGSTFGVTSDPRPTRFQVTGRSVFGQALAHGRSAKVYAEAMRQPCQQQSTRAYSHLINPWVYFTDPGERQACRRLDIPAGALVGGAFARDVSAGQLPTVGMLVPTMCHNGHNCSLSTADRWLRRRVGTIEAGPDFRGGTLTIVVTFDEDDYTTHNHVLTVVMHRGLHHRRITQHFNHFAVSALLSGFAGGPPLRDARPAPALMAAVEPGA